MVDFSRNALPSLLLAHVAQDAVNALDPRIDDQRDRPEVLFSGLADPQLLRSDDHFVLFYEGDSPQVRADSRITSASISLPRDGTFQSEAAK